MAVPPGPVSSGQQLSGSNKCTGRSCSAFCSASSCFGVTLWRLPRCSASPWDLHASGCFLHFQQIPRFQCGLGDWFATVSTAATLARWNYRHVAGRCNVVARIGQAWPESAPATVAATRLRREAGIGAGGSSGETCAEAAPGRRGCGEDRCLSFLSDRMSRFQSSHEPHQGDRSQREDRVTGHSEPAKCLHDIGVHEIWTARVPVALIHRSPGLH